MNRPRLSLHPLFSDHAVLQRDRANMIWGRGVPGAEITVSLSDAETSTRVSDDGAWALELPAGPARDGLTLRVVSNGETLERRNLAIGEVWVGSGQSNMEWPMTFVEDARREIAGATDGGIRLFTVPRLAAPEPCRTVRGAAWAICSPAAVQNFSAVAYFFARELRRELGGVPVGLIHASWGGSAIQAWLPGEDAAGTAAVLDDFARRWRAWADRECHADPGNAGEGQGWADPGFDDGDWEEMFLPGLWESDGHDIDGSVWFRRSLDLPPNWAGQDLVLHLGRADDYDTTYFNGERVGGLGRETPLTPTIQRTYVVPGRLVRSGRNVLATRIFDHAGGGGILADSGWHFNLIRANSAEARPLTGIWRMRIERALPSRPGTIWASMPPPPAEFSAQFELSQRRAGLFNGMIAPLAPYGARGVLWYQGESNAHEPARYPAQLRELVTGWRALWQNPELAFHVAQLADWSHGMDDPSRGHSPWSDLREAQTTVLELPHTGLAVTRDLGDLYDIHPRNKQGVGRRLALQVLKRIHGREIEADGPTLDHASFDGDRVRLRFKHVGSGLRTKDGDGVRGFIVTGGDGAYVAAEARVTGPDQVEVWSPRVARPVAARYAWAAFSDANLENSAGLPAGPFRTG